MCCICRNKVKVKLYFNYPVAKSARGKETYYENRMKACIDMLYVYCTYNGEILLLYVFMNIYNIWQRTIMRDDE